MKPTDNLAKISALAKRIAACKLCPLAQGRMNVVPGAGNPAARILLIGEAPGKNEDESGQPFVGMAGRFLDKLLMHAGLNREAVFVSNTVKCRPPENRAPERSEVEACRDYLNELVEILQPELIICLGGTSAKAVLGLKQISDSVGKMIERDGRYYFVTHHPAARFHRKKIQTDFDNLRLELDKHPWLREPRVSISL